MKHYASIFLLFSAAIVPHMVSALPQEPESKIEAVEKIEQDAYFWELNYCDDQSVCIKK